LATRACFEELRFLASFSVDDGVASRARVVEKTVVPPLLLIVAEATVLALLKTVSPPLLLIVAEPAVLVLLKTVTPPLLLIVAEAAVLPLSDSVSASLLLTKVGLFAEKLTIPRPVIAKKLILKI
jgi:hypothetical protein